MASKTWKLGEVAQGGVITAEVSGKKVSIIGKEWDSSKGWSKSSNQSGAKEFTRKTVNVDDNDAEWHLSLFASELSTSYWGDQIMEWIKTQVKFPSRW